MLAVIEHPSCFPHEGFCLKSQTGRRQRRRAGHLSKCTYVDSMVQPAKEADQQVPIQLLPELYE